MIFGNCADCGAYSGGYYSMDGLNRGDYGAST